MKNTRKKGIIISVSLLISFIAWTLLVRIIDVRAIGPNNSSVGFSELNSAFHALTGTNMLLYTITDWLGLVPIGTALGFALLGLVQWVKRKRIWAVDRSILALGGFYLVVMLVYMVFEFAVINYRPVLIENRLEASYPSSTTMLVMCVMPTAMMQINRRIKNAALRITALSVFAAFTAFTVIGRLVSGVHWLSDIVGGIFISSGLVSAYYSVTASFEQ